MLAFTQGISKSEFMVHIRRHHAADAFIRGNYWDANKEKGCAIGCSLKSVSEVKGIKLKSYSDHSAYETHLGIPEWLARVEDCFFEYMSLARSQTWPVDFADAIREGADLETVRAPFMIHILQSTLDIREVKEDLKVLKSSQDVIELWKKYPKGPYAARSAAERAAWSAAWSAAESAAWSAAESAARSAAWSAAWSAARSAAGSAAWSAAESAAFDQYADKLLELLRSA